MSGGRASLAAAAASSSDVQPHSTTLIFQNSTPPCKETKDSDGCTAPCTVPIGCNAFGAQREGEGGRFESADGALSHREKSCRVLRETISDAKNILRLWQRLRPCSQDRHGFMSWGKK